MERTVSAPDQELPTVEEAGKWLGIPKTTWADWVRHGRVPPPHGPNKAVLFYSWEQVYAIRVLLATGFLPLPAKVLPPKPPKTPEPGK
jgi:hypothetical protein